MLSRWRGAVFGGVTFLGTHAVEAGAWGTWFAPGVDHAAWFLNSGRAVALTVVCLFAVGALNGAFGSADQREALVRGAYFSGGAIVSMSVVLIVIGPGTLAPLAWLIGAVIVAKPGVSGALVGWAIRRAHRQ